MIKELFNKLDAIEVKIAAKKKVIERAEKSLRRMEEKSRWVQALFSMMTRVIVDENATEDQIIAASYKGFQAKIDNRELGDNLEPIEDNEEVPYGEAPDDKLECPVCNRHNLP